MDLVAEFSRLASQFSKLRRPALRTRSLLIAGFAVCTSLLGTSQASRAEEITVRVGHFPNITHVQALIARNFERKGENWLASRLGPNVRVEWFTYNAGPSAMEAIFADAIDLTYVGPNPAINAYARSKGEEIRIIAGAVNGGAALVVRRDGGLTKPADFRGKRLATPQFGNTQDVAARAWLTAGGLRVTQTGGDVQVIPTSNPDQLSMFQRGDLDAVWTVEPWVSRLETEAEGKVLLEQSDAVTTILVSGARFLTAHPDLARRFAAANRELTEWIAKNPEQAQSMLRDELVAETKTDFPLELVSKAWRRMTITSDVSITSFESFAADAQKAGFLRSVPDFKRFVEVP
jgi:NitT/TauT family transport system substrate-binding protein